MNNEQYVRARIAHENAIKHLNNLAEHYAQAELREKNRRILDVAQIVMDLHPILGEVASTQELPPALQKIIETQLLNSVALNEAEAQRLAKPNVSINLTLPKGHPERSVPVEEPAAPECSCAGPQHDGDCIHHRY
jgi:hypothetical protein